MINDKTPTAMTVSTMLRPRRPFAPLRRKWALLGLLSLTLCTPLPSSAQPAFPHGKVAAKVAFHVSPDYARVAYQEAGTTTWHDIGPVDGKPPVEYAPPGSSKTKSINFRFSVPQWGGKSYPDWSTVKRDDFPDFLRTVDTSQLKNGVPPDGSTLQLPLPMTVRLQAYTFLYPTQSAGLLLLLAAAAVVASRWRSILARLVPPPVPAVDPYQIGDYSLSAKIGEGGMGEVWAASSVGELKCALKFIKKELLDDPDMVRRLEREIKICLPLNHPNLLKLHGYGSTVDGRMYTVSELLEGQTLKKLIASGDFDPPQLAAKVLEQIGDALLYLHERSLIHRDIKPDNIFVCSDGSLKLMDMGLLHGAGRTVITQTGNLVGTPAYMAPEQSDDKATCSATDQYALGIILYEILAGQRPFIQPEIAMLIYQHKFVAPLPPSEHNVRISSDMEEPILRMLEKKPEDRFPSLKEAQEALERMSFTTWNDTSEDTQQARLKKLS